MKSPVIPRVLIVAGSDSGGGAGIQADIKTVTMLGGFAMTAITAITAQNTRGVQAIHPVPEDIIRQQIMCVVEDIGVDVIKIGMLGDAATIRLIAGLLRKVIPAVPVVLDTVMQAKGGASLLQEEAEISLITELLPLAHIITPNIPEAEKLTGRVIKTDNDMLEAARQLSVMTEAAILIKGGHREGDRLINLLYHPVTEPYITCNSRIDTIHTHGTGCTLASAMATCIGYGIALPEALNIAEAYVRGAIENAPQFGKGHGPMHHGWINKENTLEFI